MSESSRVPEWPDWIRYPLLALLALVIGGLLVRSLLDATSLRDAARGVGGVGILCLWLAYRYGYATRWRGESPRRAGIAFLCCLAITVGTLAALGPADGQAFDGDLPLALGLGAVFGLALVLEPSISPSKRTFGALLLVVGLGIVGLGLTGFGAGVLGWLETIFVGAICFVFGLLYLFRPDELAELTD